MVLVILIALWAMVLLPPYLKDRRASSRSFRSGMSSGISSANAAQRFLPLQNASSRYSTSAVSSPTGMRTSGVSTFGSGTIAHSSVAGRSTRSMATASARDYSGLSSGAARGAASANVVQLRPVEDRQAHRYDAAAYDHAPQYWDHGNGGGSTFADEIAFDDGHASPFGDIVAHNSPRFGMPHSTAAARERRRQVLLGLTSVAVLTLLLALFAGGRWIAAHVFVDLVMVGYVILLVRHRQLMVDRLSKVEPIRPPVSEQPPASMQLAPSYLVSSRTGS